MSRLLKDLTLTRDLGQEYIPARAPHAAYDEVVYVTHWTIIGFLPTGVGKPGDTVTSGGLFPIWGPVTVPVTIHHAADPGDPGQPYRAPSITQDYHQGWNASANSVQTCSRPGQLSFTVPLDTVGVVVGLATEITGSGYLNVRYGFYVSDGNYRVMESGIIQTFIAPYDGSDLTVRVVGSVVDYFVGSTLVYTSLSAAPNAPLYAYASQYMGGDVVADAAFSETISVGLTSTATGAGVMRTPLGESYGDDGDGYAIAVGSMRTPTGTGTDPDSIVGAGVMRSPVGESYLGNYRIAVGSMRTPQGFGEDFGFLAPQFTVGDGAVKNWAGGGSDAAVYYAQGAGRMRHPMAFAGDITGNYTVGQGEWSSWAGESGDYVSQGWGYVEGPHAIVHGFAHSSPIQTNNITGTVGIVQGFTGAQGSIVGTHGVIAGAVTVTVLGRGEITGTVGVVVGSATVSVLASGAITGPSPAAVEGFGGANGAITGTSGAVSGTVFVGGVATGSITGTHAVVAGAGTVGVVLSGAITGTVGYIAPTARGAIVGTVGIVTGSVTLSVTVEYEAYSFELQETEKGTQTAATRYTNYPFSRIVRWRGHYYGMSTDGLYLLEGDDFDGTPIVSVVKTGFTDDGKTEMKQARSLYFSGRIGADMTVTAYADELTDDGYDYSPASLDGAKNHRVLLGRGIRARYFAFGFTNFDGGDWQLDGLRPLLDPTKRNIWR